MSSVRATDVADAVVPTEFDELFRAMWPPMVRLATGLVDSQSAEDVVQDAFFALHGKWQSLHDPDAAAAYLRVSVVNSARSVLRKRRTSRARQRVLYEPEAESADAALMLSVEHQAVRDAMSGLPDRQREVLTMRFLTDCTDAQIADATGLSEAGVRSASSRALAKLRDTLGGAS